MLRFIIVEIGLIFGIAALFRWRYGVLLIFFWLYIEDIIRKIIPGQPPETTLVKEFIILITYLSFFASVALRPRMNIVFRRLTFFPALIVFLVIAVAAATYSIVPSPWTIGLGFRTYFWYIPFAFIGYFMFRSEELFRRFASALVYTSIPLMIIAAIQLRYWGEIDFILLKPFLAGDPLHSFLNTYIPFISSVFGSHGRFARYSFLLYLLGLGLLVGSNSQSKNRLLVISIISAAVSVFLSGQRTVMYLLVIGLALFVGALAFDFIKIHKYGKQTARAIFVGAAISISVSLVVILWFPLVGEYFLHFSSVIDRFTEFVPSDISIAIAQGGYTGQGFGIASQGINYVPDSVGLVTEVGVESGIGKLWLEMGIAGTLVFVMFIIAVLSTGLRQIYRLPTLSRKGLAAASMIFFAGSMFEFFFLHHQVYGDATTLIPMWFFIGVVFGMQKWPYALVDDLEEVNI